MKHIKIFEEYEYSKLNEEMGFKNWLNKLCFLGLASLVTIVGCKDPITYKGEAVVTDFYGNKNVVTPKMITVDTKIGKFNLSLSYPDDDEREPFTVKRGDTLYIDINTHHNHSDYISKIKNGKSRQTTSLWGSNKIN